MRLQDFLKIFINPFIGPIIVTTIIAVLAFLIYIPDISQKNQIDDLKKNAVAFVNKLKKIRSYYTNNVINDIKSTSSSVKINYDHADKEDTIPLPATLVHNLSEILPQNGMKVKMYSNYPFPNRKDRVLSDEQIKALDYVEKNPHKIYTKLSNKENGKFLHVTVSDIFYDQACVNCHNSRSDTPKNDWNLGDVRGAIEVIVPFDDGIYLKSNQIMLILSIYGLLTLILAIHYFIIAKKQKNLYTDTKTKLESEIANSTKTLNQYKKAVDLTAIVSKTDPSGKITYVNEQFCKISGYTQEELIGKSHNIIRHPDMPDNTFKELWSTIKSKKIWSGQIKNKAKNGSSYYVASTVVPLTDSDDNIVEFLAIRLDVSDIVESRIQAEKADMSKSIFLANMSHEIRTPLNAIIGFSQVLSNSKELNNENKKQAHIIESSANALLAIINDILDISKIESGNFQVNIENSDLYKVCEDVVELFSKRAAQNNLKFVFNMDNKVPLCVRTDATRIKQVLSNLISNAIKFTNSFGEIDLNVVYLENIRDNEVLVRFEVCDSGIGIPANKLDSIFQPFIQVDSKANRKYQGTGLGLSICSHIIESLGSKIEVKSDEGEGTTFWFDIKFNSCEENIYKKSDEHLYDISIYIEDQNSEAFHHAKRYLSMLGRINIDDALKSDIVVLSYDPKDVDAFYKIKDSYSKPKLILVEYEKDMEDIVLNSDEKIVSLPYYASKLNDAIHELIYRSRLDKESVKDNLKYSGKVLVAEDNFANQELISYILNEFGVDFTIASNGKEAFDIYKKNSFDIVFMDINMPVLDGMESFKLIREYEKNEGVKYTPVIALTANAIKGDKERFLSLGMSGYISKPINTDKLNELFSKYLVKKEIKDTPKSLEPKSQKTKNLDHNSIVESLGVSENIAKLLVKKFIEEIESELDELEGYINNEESDKIKEKAHFIKNSCLNLELKKACDYLQQIETQITDSNDLKEIFYKLKQEILAVIDR